MKMIIKFFKKVIHFLKVAVVIVFGLYEFFFTDIDNADKQ
jgi:hypothetical protein